MVFDVGFLGKFEDFIAIHLNLAKAGRGIDAQHGAELRMRQMKAEFRGQISIGETIAVGYREMLGRAEVFTGGLGERCRSC